MEQAKQSVMVVDDDPDFVETVRPVLEEAGYAVVAAYNGAECLAKLDQAKPDVILLDIMMSTWGEGFAVADKLKAMGPDRGIPVILVSSLNLKSELEPGPGLQSMLSVDACLVKPVPRRELLDQVAASLKKAAGRRSGPQER